ncbi:radical SAM/SPASM domain-containing protein [Clostridium formicaceticum]|uniref:Molybdenum cofactor biosynthesis protein A n=1 Tax=Clostridium formicaceticum TaxID=1497 RepID=A0AAC9WEQ3_9CLOT|nr:radical SAM protein [Clostridium formicaceticum]AOY75665.1 radical SAM protein [Clostridium formicaceticum]ARE85981.1 molybdenum cofactor biosynthesis protein A [Clostridium formicaceticum]
MSKSVPINKGNYSMETENRERLFEKNRGEGWEEEYKQYRNNWIKYPQECIVSEYPLLVDLELSTICNLSCPMCYTITKKFRKNIKKSYMDFSLYKKIIDEIAGKVPALRLSLRGEATLHPNFIECIQYAKKKGIKEVSFLTNGSKLDYEFIEKIIRSEVDWITISIDGVGETYETIRKPMKFNNILNSVISLKSIKEKLGVKRPVVKIQTIWPAIKDDPEKYYNTFKQYVDLIAFNPLIEFSSKTSDIAYEDFFYCPQLYQRLVIGADGYALMCACDEYGKSRGHIGNANEETVYEIWHSSKLNYIRETHKKANGFKELEVCSQCFVPRKTEENESFVLDGRKIIVKNYK